MLVSSEFAADTTAAIAETKQQCAIKKHINLFLSAQRNRAVYQRRVHPQKSLAAMAMMFWMAQQRL